MISRKSTRAISVRNVVIGGGNPVVIQSMTNTPTTDVEATLGQIERLVKVGCAMVRVAVPDAAAVKAFAAIRRQTEVPLIADVHFDYRLAIAAIEAGADKVRINPGNIGGIKRLKAVVDAARQSAAAIRVGVNSGSLEREILDRYKHPCAEALAISAVNAVRAVESCNFDRVVVSVKASDVLTTVEACRALSKAIDYPQHIGITEAGTVRSGTIRSAVGLGILLAEGIGDTIRVSLAGDPVEEIFVAQTILASLGLAYGPEVIACPTCSRTQIDVASLAASVEEMVAGLKERIRIAVMGCVVNGPGEAREADVGIAGGKGEGIIFMRGKPIVRLPEDQLLPELKLRIQQIIDSQRGC